VNLGVAGAGPRFFADSEPILDVVNGASFAVIMVMSGRSCSTPIWECRGGYAGGFLHHRESGHKFQFASAVRHSLKKGKAHARLVRRQFREAYMWDFAQLLARVRVPSYLVWMSARQPAFKFGEKSLKNFAGKFPHFVDGEMLAQLRANTQGFVRVVSPETAGPESHYPGPGMHAAVAEKLADVIDGRDRTNSDRRDG